MHSLLLLLMTSDPKADFSLKWEFDHSQFQQKEPHCWGSSSLCEPHSALGLLWLLLFPSNHPGRWITATDAALGVGSKGCVNKQPLALVHIPRCQRLLTLWTILIFNITPCFGMENPDLLGQESLSISIIFSHYLPFLSLFSREAVSGDGRSSQGFSGIKPAQGTGAICRVQRGRGGRGAAKSSLPKPALHTNSISNKERFQ